MCSLLHLLPKRHVLFWKYVQITILTQFFHWIPQSSLFYRVFFININRFLQKNISKQCDVVDGNVYLLCHKPFTKFQSNWSLWIIQNNFIAHYTYYIHIQTRAYSSGKYVWRHLITWLQQYQNNTIHSTLALRQTSAVLASSHWEINRKIVIFFGEIVGFIFKNLFFYNPVWLILPIICLSIATKNIFKW